MLSPDKSVTALFPHAPHSPLAVALAVGLTALGWEVRCDAEGGSGVPMVIAANDEGRLQLPDVSAAPAASRLLVLVGGLACLSELANGLLLGASAAVNADLPFPEVIGRVDAVLRAGAPQPDDRDCLRGRLHQRRVESERFKRLTDREAAVLAELAAGLTAADIAHRRPAALATVRSQIAGILHKLEVSSQTAAVALTYQACRDERILAALRPHQHY